MQDCLEEKVRLATDCTPLLKRHSDCLAGRCYVAVPNNKILKNKPIDVGYSVSSVQLNFADKWCVPLDQQLLDVSSNALDTAVKQLRALLDIGRLASEKKIVNTADSAYGTPRFLSPLYDNIQLINVVRMRAGMKLWTGEARTNTGGANGIYGDCYYLNLETQDKNYKYKGKDTIKHQVSLYDLPSNEVKIIEAATQKGRKISITLTRWNDLLRRAEKQYSMKEKPVDIVGVLITDSLTGEKVFERPLFIALSGKQKDTISTIEAYQDYHHRYDIEHSFRFQKQQLLLQKYQTPDVQTLQNWLLVVQLAQHLLFLAADEVPLICPKWQQYNNKPKPNTQGLSPCQTKKAALSLFNTFDKTPFLPQKSKKGKGRIPGTTLEPKPLQKVTKKTQNKTKKTKSKSIEPPT